MLNINQLIRELESEFYDSKGFLWSKKSLIDIEKCGQLVHKIKNTMPQSLADIEYLNNEKKRLTIQATRIIEDANERAEQIISESELVLKAEEEAERIKMHSIKDIKLYEASAMKRLSNMLGTIESFLVDALNNVKNSRDEIEDNIEKIDIELKSRSNPNQGYNHRNNDRYDASDYREREDDNNKGRKNNRNYDNDTDNRNNYHRNNSKERYSGYDDLPSNYKRKNNPNNN